MSLYERYKLYPIVPTDMEDLPMKASTTKAQSEKSAVAKASTTRSSTAKPTPVRRRSTTTRRKTATSKRPVKPLPPLQGDQPRDALGRFARKTGQVLWGAAKATGRAIVGTAKGIHRTHTRMMRAHAGYQRRARLEERERHIALAEREHRLGLRKKRVIRRRNR